MACHGGGYVAWGCCCAKDAKQDSNSPFRLALGDELHLAR